MKKIILPGLLIGLVNFIASMLVSKIFGVIFPVISVEYQNTSLFRQWTDPLMLLFFIYPFLLGIILAWFWDKTKSIYGEGTSAGLKFGLTYWIVATIPGMFITYSSMPYSLLMIISWLVEGLIAALLAGIILTKLNK